MRIALFQPDIAGNVGTILRTSACFGVPVDIIEPCGFPYSDRKLKRAGMDYAAEADVSRHANWAAFRESRSARIVLLTVDGDSALPDARFETDDILMAGSESAGAPPYVHDAAAMRIHIPMRSGFRSLNVAIATGIALGEALRQTGNWPE
jgi:tRNA (cytidine/uridine-2'-O-)-methyltransferase